MSESNGDCLFAAFASPWTAGYCFGLQQTGFVRRCCHAYPTKCWKQLVCLELDLVPVPKLTAMWVFDNIYGLTTWNVLQDRHFLCRKSRGNVDSANCDPHFKIVQGCQLIIVCNSSCIINAYGTSTYGMLSPTEWIKWKENKSIFLVQYTSDLKCNDYLSSWVVTKKINIEIKLDKVSRILDKADYTWKCTK